MVQSAVRANAWFHIAFWQIASKPPVVVILAVFLLTPRTLYEFYISAVKKRMFCKREGGSQ
jgi:hypothetical protein